MGNSESCEHDLSTTELLQFDTDQLGVPITIYKSALSHKCNRCGHTSVTVPYPERLAAAAAVFRCKGPDRLLGAEIKFLRKCLEWTATKLADALSVTPETVSRWENDERPMTAGYERLFRVLVVSALQAKAPAIDVDIQDLVQMKIRAIRPPIVARMALALVMFKEVKKEPAQEYSELPKKAA